MTGADPPQLYPQYCFHLSPTIHKWCHLRAADIVALTSHPGFEGQNLFFHVNHPMKWVRVAGVVIAIDEFGPWRAYTVDDGSGVTIECHIPLPKTANGINTDGHAAGAVGLPNTANQHQKSGIVDAEINIGDVIDVKGGIRVFRENRHIKAEKIVHLRSTEQEVQFWEKLSKLRKETLDQPWTLDKRVVRKCRKEAEGHGSSRARRDPRDRQHQRKSPAAEEMQGGAKPLADRGQPQTVIGKPKARVTGLEKRAKPVKRTLPITGKYDALGL